MAGIEPASSAWKAEVIATIRHPQAYTFPGHGLTDFLGLFQGVLFTSIYTPIVKMALYSLLCNAVISRPGVDYDIHPCMSPCGPHFVRSNVLSLGHPGLTKNPGICHPGQIRSAGKYATGIFPVSASPRRFLSNQWTKSKPRIQLLNRAPGCSV